MNRQKLIKLIIQSLLCGIVCWLIVAFILGSQQPEQTFAQVLTSSQSLIIGIAAIIGSFIGFWRRR